MKAFWLAVFAASLAVAAVPGQAALQVAAGVLVGVILVASVALRRQTLDDRTTVGFWIASIFVAAVVVLVVWTVTLPPPKPELGDTAGPGNELVVAPYTGTLHLDEATGTWTLDEYYRFDVPSMNALDGVLEDPAAGPVSVGATQEVAERLSGRILPGVPPGNLPDTGAVGDAADTAAARELPAVQWAPGSHTGAPTIASSRSVFSAADNLWAYNIVIEIGRPVGTGFRLAPRTGASAVVVRAPSNTVIATFPHVTLPPQLEGSSTYEFTLPVAEDVKQIELRLAPEWARFPIGKDVVSLTTTDAARYLSNWMLAALGAAIGAGVLSLIARALGYGPLIVLRRRRAGRGTDSPESDEPATPPSADDDGGE